MGTPHRTRPSGRFIPTLSCAARWACRGGIAKRLRRRSAKPLFSGSNPDAASSDTSSAPSGGRFACRWGEVRCESREPEAERLAVSAVTRASVGFRLSSGITRPEAVQTAPSPFLQAEGLLFSEDHCHPSPSLTLPKSYCQAYPRLLQCRSDRGEREADCVRSAFASRLSAFGLVPGWWNGRHCGLKIRWGFKLRGGSNPSPGTRQAEAARMESRVPTGITGAWAGSPIAARARSRSRRFRAR